MRLGVVSDTHGRVQATRDAVRLLDHAKIDMVIHCGDIGSPDVVPLFMPWTTHFVFGNVDYDRQVLRAAIEEAGKQCHEAFGHIVLNSIRIAFLHSDDGRRFRTVTASSEWDLVCYGHTHEPEYHYEGRTLVLNPGAIHRASPRTIAVVEIPSLEVKHLELASS